MEKKRKLTSYFELKNRDQGSSFWTLTDDRPEWLLDAVREAHHGALPSDWVYAEARAVCEAIDCEDLDFDGRAWEDSLHEYVDARVDIYTSDVFQWAAELANSSLFADAEERANDVGVEGAFKEGGVVKVLQVIQYHAIESIAQAICEAYDAAREEDDDEEDQATADD